MSMCCLRRTWPTDMLAGVCWLAHVTHQKATQAGSQPISKMHGRPGLGPQKCKGCLCQGHQQLSAMGQL